MKEALTLITSLLLCAAFLYELIILMGPWYGIPFFIFTVYELIKQGNGKGTDA